MAIFKIISCRACRNEYATEFLIEYREGVLAAGDKFVCYDTHHPITFVVDSYAHEGSQVRLTCMGVMSFDEQFATAVINTCAKGRPAGFHYEHASRSA